MQSARRRFKQRRSHLEWQQDDQDIAENAMDFYRSYVEKYQVYGAPLDTTKRPD